MKILLKIGPLNIPINRWIDALDFFDKIYVLTTWNIKELNHPKIVYLKLKANTINKVLYTLLRNEKINNRILLLYFVIYLLRIFNHKFLKQLKKIDFYAVHSSYNDFDDSALLTIFARNQIKNMVLTRAVKESRPKIILAEKINFKIAQRVVFNTEFNYSFFKKKYPEINWDEKEIIFNLDEDYRSIRILKGIKLSKRKLSDKDKKIHIVILAGRVLSDDKEVRSGSRLYYIPLIEEILKSPKFIVHLHTLKITLSKDGVDKYAELKKKYPFRFFIEPGLNFESEPFISYSVLSKYDYGITNNFTKKSAVSTFDKFNIPHRFYEYLAANVVPIVRMNETVVMENILSKRKQGVLFRSFDELEIPNQFFLNREIDNYNFRSYIMKLYNIEKFVQKQITHSRTQKKQNV